MPIEETIWHPIVRVKGVRVDLFFEAEAAVPRLVGNFDVRKKSTLTPLAFLPVAAVNELLRMLQTMSKAAAGKGGGSKP